MSDEDGTKPPKRPIIDLTEYRESRGMGLREPSREEAEGFRSITTLVSYLNAMRDQLLLAGWDDHYAQSIAATVLVHSLTDS